MRALIVGGTGLIGTALAFELVRRGHEVTALHRGRRERHGPRELRYLTADRRERAAFEAAMAAHETDVVYDMTAYDAADAESAVRAFEGRVSRYVLCSTVCVYGGPLAALPAGETTERRPVSAYGRGKVACEDVVLAAHAAGRLPATILRPAYVYGEGGTLLHSLGWRTTFLARLRAGRPVVVHGDGQSLFSACFAADAAVAFAAAAEAPEAPGRVYNVAAETGGATFLDYLGEVASAVGGTLDPRFVPCDTLAALAPGRTNATTEVFRYNMSYDCRRARDELGFAASTPVHDGARATVRWLEAHGRLERWQDDTYDDRLIDAWAKARETLPREDA